MNSGFPAIGFWQLGAILIFRPLRCYYCLILLVPTQWNIDRCRH